MRKIDHILFGTLAGFITPMLFLVVLFLKADIEMNFFDSLKYSFQIRILGSFLQLALLLNLGLFMIFLKMNYLKFCSGVLLATILSGMFMVYMYFF
jgi:uncharacterized membrane protein